MDIQELKQLIYQGEKVDIRAFQPFLIHGKVKDG